VNRAEHKLHLSKVQREGLLEALHASDGVAWLTEPTTRVLLQHVLVERLHATCRGVRLTDDGRKIAKVLDAAAQVAKGQGVRS